MTLESKLNTQLLISNLYNLPYKIDNGTLFCGDVPTKKISYVGPDPTNPEVCLINSSNTTSVSQLAPIIIMTSTGTVMRSGHCELYSEGFEKFSTGPKPINLKMLQGIQNLDQDNAVGPVQAEVLVANENLMFRDFDLNLVFTPDVVEPAPRVCDYNSKIKFGSLTHEEIYESPRQQYLNQNRPQINPQKIKKMYRAEKANPDLPTLTNYKQESHRIKPKPENAFDLKFGSDRPKNIRGGLKDELRSVKEITDKNRQNSEEIRRVQKDKAFNNNRLTIKSEPNSEPNEMSENAYGVGAYGYGPDESGFDIVGGGGLGYNRCFVDEVKAQEPLLIEEQMPNFGGQYLFSPIQEMYADSPMAFDIFNSLGKTAIGLKPFLTSRENCNFYNKKNRTIYVATNLGLMNLSFDVDYKVINDGKIIALKAENVRKELLNVLSPSFGLVVVADERTPDGEKIFLEADLKTIVETLRLFR